MKKKPKRLVKNKASKTRKIRPDLSTAALALALSAVGKRAVAGDETSARMLWASFNWMAGALAMMADQGSCAVDMECLFNITQRCQHMLKGALRRTDAAALRVALGVAAGGCDILKEAAAQDMEFVASFAEEASDWPVRMACKRFYHEDADAYLRSIRVGTRGNPRTTAGTHVNATAEVRPAELASMILRKLRFYCTILGRDAAGLQFPIGSSRTAEQNLRVEAKEFKEILKLPELTAATWQQWWRVGRSILEKYWANDQKQEATDVDKIGGNGDPDSRKSARTYAIGKIRSAFYTAAKAVFPPAPVVAQG
ncbi:MAG: hypothetical protein ACR2NX_04245 [Chthoniobacterales bacterium]